MLKFDDLSKGLEQGSEANVKPSFTPKKTGELKFSQLIGEEPIKQGKLSKEEIERRRLTEPGHKIPTANYQQVGQYCETCGDLTGHAHNIEKKKLRCLICKNDKSYG